MRSTEGERVKEQAVKHSGFRSFHDLCLYLMQKKKLGKSEGELRGLRGHPFVVGEEGVKHAAVIRLDHDG